MPSCIRAPPLRVTHTTGRPSSTARSKARTTRSPCDHAHRPAQHLEAALDAHVGGGPAGRHRLLGMLGQAIGVAGGAEGVAADEVARPTPRSTSWACSLAGATNPAPTRRAQTGTRRRAATSLASRRPERVRTRRSPSACDQVAEDLPVVGGQRPDGHAGAGAQRQLQALEHALVRVELLASRRPGRGPPRRRRCSARACAGSSSGRRRGGRGRRSPGRRTRPSTSRGGCGGTGARAGPSWRSRTTRSRPPRARWRRRRTCRPGRRRRGDGRGRGPAACRPRR